MPIQVDFKFDFDKFLAAVQYLAFRDIPELTKYKVIKLIFLADKYHTVRYGRPIIGDRYCALDYGPVPSAALDRLNAFLSSPDAEDDEIAKMRKGLSVDRRFQHPRFLANKAPKFSNMSRSDIMALDHIIEHFGDKGFEELKAITHNIYAYRVTREKDPNGTMRYEDFFSEDPDAIDGALDELLENDTIRRGF